MLQVDLYFADEAGIIVYSSWMKRKYDEGKIYFE